MGEMDRTSRNMIPGQPQSDDGGMNAILAKLLMQKAQEPAYVMPGEPPAKAWAPAIAQLGALLAGKRETSANNARTQQLGDVLAGIAGGKEGGMMEGQLPQDGMGPGAPTQGPNVPYSENEKMALMARVPSLQGMVAQRLSGVSDKSQPSAIQEWNEFRNMTPENQSRYLEMKRNPTIMNLGGAMSVRSPGGGIGESYAVTPKPDQMPAFQGAQKRAQEIGKEAGIQESALSEMEGNLPRLETVVDQLGVLGETATYTKSGQALDIGRRELGLDPRKEAIARKEYISKVDNEVLPLLRQTFGAAFTEREGTSLKATLGDPNASPAEKSAVLRSFIDSKRAQVETQKRRVGKEEAVKPTPGNSSIEDLLKKY